MADWKRATWEISFDQAPAEVKSEIQRHLEYYNLGDILLDVIMCIQSNGKFTDITENSSAFLGLEENAAGQKFKELAISAVQNAKK